MTKCLWGPRLDYVLKVLSGGWPSHSVDLIDLVVPTCHKPHVLLLSRAPRAPNKAFIMLNTGPLDVSSSFAYGCLIWIMICEEGLDALSMRVKWAASHEWWGAPVIVLIVVLLRMAGDPAVWGIVYLSMMPADPIDMSPLQSSSTPPSLQRGI